MNTAINKYTELHPGSTVRGLAPIQIEGYASTCGVGFHYTVKSVNGDGTATIYRDECAGVPHYATVPVAQIEPAYKVVNGLFYDNKAHPDAIRAIEEARRCGYRVRISKGYTEFDNPMEGSTKKIGEDWLEENDVEGKIGNSMGPMKVPLLVARGERGGGAITGGCIVRVRIAGKGGRVLWQHPAYHKPVLTVRPLDATEAAKPEMVKYKLTHEVLADGQIQARFKSEAAAQQYVAKFD